MASGIGIVGSRGSELYTKALDVLGRSQLGRIVVLRTQFRGHEAIVQIDSSVQRVGVSIQISPRAPVRLSIAPGGRATVSCEMLAPSEQQQIVFSLAVLEEARRALNIVFDFNCTQDKWASDRADIICLPNALRQSIFSRLSGHPPCIFLRGKREFRLLVSEGTAIFGLCSRDHAEPRASVLFGSDGSVVSVQNSSAFNLQPWELVRVVDRLLISGKFHKRS
jgi:hypothetical protein